MLTAVSKHLDLMKAYFKLNLSASMEYRTSFIVQVIGMMLNNLSFAFFWWLLFQRFNTIGGFGYKDVMMLWALSSAGFGLCFVLFGNIDRIVLLIIKGELDSYLLQPKNVLINSLASRTRISAWGDILYGIGLFMLLKGFDPVKWVLFLLFVITAALIFASVFTTANALAFWFGNIESLSRLVFEFMVTFTIYPSGIFDGFTRFLLFSVLPAGFISMLPVSVINTFSIKWLMVILGAAILWVSIAFWVFHRGLKHYESGNLMVQKL